MTTFIVMTTWSRPHGHDYMVTTTCSRLHDHDYMITTTFIVITTLSLQPYHYYIVVITLSLLHYLWAVKTFLYYHFVFLFYRSQPSPRICRHRSEWLGQVNNDFLFLKQGFCFYVVKIYKKYICRDSCFVHVTTIVRTVTIKVKNFYCFLILYI